MLRNTQKNRMVNSPVCLIHPVHTLPLTCMMKPAILLFVLCIPTTLRWFSVEYGVGGRSMAFGAPPPARRYHREPANQCELMTHARSLNFWILIILHRLHTTNQLSLKSGEQGKCSFIRGFCYRSHCAHTEWLYCATLSMMPTRSRLD